MNYLFLIINPILLNHFSKRSVILISKCAHSTKKNCFKSISTWIMLINMTIFLGNLTKSSTKNTILHSKQAPFPNLILCSFILKVHIWSLLECNEFMRGFIRSWKRRRQFEFIRFWNTTMAEINLKASSTFPYRLFVSWWSHTRSVATFHLQKITN